MAPAIDWIKYEELKAEGLADREIARQWGIPWGTFHRQKQRYTGPHPSTPVVKSRHTPAHSGTPARQQSTQVHLSTPMPPDLLRMLALLPDLEVIVARERDRQRLWGVPISTPRHTIKKTYVFDTLYVDLIERYAREEGLDLKDVINLMCYEFFERRQYLPSEG